MAGITGIAGQPGAGKSYSVVDLFIIPSLKENRRIVTNVPLNLDAIKSEYPDVNIEQIQDITKHDWSKVGDGCILILDEVWRLWKQGTKLNAIPDDQLSLLKECRHRSDSNGRSMDIVLISQDLGDICSPVRQLMEASILCCKHLDLGAEDRFIRYYCRNAAKIDSKTNAPPNSQVVRSENGKYDPKVYKYYQSHMHGSGAPPQEQRIVTSTIFGSWKWKAGAVVTATCIIAMIWGMQRTVENMDKFTGKNKSPLEQQAAIPPEQTVVAVATPKPSYSADWRIGGVMYNHQKSGVTMFVLVSQKKAIRYVHGRNCNKIDFEDYCTVDGEVVTWFSGRSSAAYLPDESPVQALSESKS